MEYTCIYEALPNKLVTLPFIVFCVIELVVTICGIVSWKNNSVSGKIGMCIVFALLLLVIGTMLYNYYSSYTIWDAYEKENSLVIEGIIEDYVVGTEEKISFPDRFTVSGVSFIVSNSPSSGYGYTMRQYDGGVLQDGLYCKIYYVPHKYENVIMKILIKQPHDCQQE